MDNLAAQLSSLLDSPEGMDKIKNMASMFLGSGGDSTAAVKDDEPAVPIPPLLPDNSAMPAISPDQIQTMMSMIGAFQSGGDDNRSRLLLSLRPHLSHKRQARVDSAVKILKLVSMMPLLSQTGLLDFFN